MAVTKGIVNTGNINSTGQVIAPGLVNLDASNRKNNQFWTTDGNYVTGAAGPTGATGIQGVTGFGVTGATTRSTTCTSVSSPP